MECVGELIVYGVGGMLLAIALTWIVLAFFVGAWRAPVIAYAGAAMGSYGLRLTSGYLLAGEVAGSWGAALIGGLAFGAVAGVCLPGLRRTVRFGGIAVLLGVAAWAVVIGPSVA
jgi:uncharacterized membrane protein